MSIQIKKIRKFMQKTSQVSKNPDDLYSKVVQYINNQFRAFDAKFTKLMEQKVDKNELKGLLKTAYADLAKAGEESVKALQERVDRNDKRYQAEFDKINKLLAEQEKKIDQGAKERGLMAEEIKNLKATQNMFGKTIDYLFTKIKAVYKVEYDNKLLNHSKIVSYCKEEGFSHSAIVDFGDKFPDLVIEAINTENPEVILAGLMSLESNI
jgi:hypothetical protein